MSLPAQGQSQDELGTASFALTAREVELLREIRLHANFTLNKDWHRTERNLLRGIEKFYAARLSNHPEKKE